MTCRDEVLNEMENGNEEVLTQVESVITGSVLVFVVQHIVNGLRSPLTKTKTAMLLYLIQCVKTDLAPIRNLLESDSFWKETVYQEQEYIEWM